MQEEGEEEAEAEGEEAAVAAEEEMVLEAYVQLPSSTALEVAPRALVKVEDQVSYVS